MAEGIVYGDALSLSAPQNLLSSDEVKPEMTLGRDIFPLKIISDALTQEQKTRLLSKFQAP